MPAGLIFVPGNVEYLLQFATEIKFTISTKITAFADNQFLLTRGETVSDIEIIANLEMTKPISGKRKNIGFKEKKSKAMLMTGEKGKKVGKLMFN